MNHKQLMIFNLFCWMPVTSAAFAFLTSDWKWSIPSLYIVFIGYVYVLFAPLIWDAFFRREKPQQRIQFTTSGALPSGFEAGVTYFAERQDDITFKISKRTTINWRLPFFCSWYVVWMLSLGALADYAHLIHSGIALMAIVLVIFGALIAPVLWDLFGKESKR